MSYFYPLEERGPEASLAEPLLNSNAVTVHLFSRVQVEYTGMRLDVWEDLYLKPLQKYEKALRLALLIPKDHQRLFNEDARLGQCHDLIDCDGRHRRPVAPSD